MAIKSQKLLPSAEIRVSKKTISTSFLRELKPEKPIEIGKVSKKDSLGKKFGVIFDFLKKEYKRDRKSWFRDRKRKQEERRKKREEELEKNKGKSKIGKGIRAALPLKNIFDSIGNFLLFLAGGFLLNKIFDFLPQLIKIAEKLRPIITGIYNFGKFIVESVIGFIEAGYDIHDSLRQKVEDLGGEEAVEKFDKFAGLFKKVINGAIIMAMISTLMPRGPRGGKKFCPPCPCLDLVPQPFRVPSTIIIQQPKPIDVTVPGGEPAGQPFFDPNSINIPNFGDVWDWLKNLLPGKKPAQIPGDVDTPVIDPVKDPVIDWGSLAKSPQLLYQFVKANSGQLLLDPEIVATLIAAGVLTQVDGPLLPFGDAAGFNLAAASIILKLKKLNKLRLLVIPAGAALLSRKTATASELQSVDDETPTKKMEVIGKPITQWYDLEGEFDYNVPMLIFEKTKLQTIIQQE
mgnify:CR=1 FL=1